jgi:PAS domain S-box-containing protein
MRLCEASFGFFLRYQEGKYAFAAGSGLRPEFAEYLSRMDQPGPDEANIRAVEGTPYVHTADLKDEHAYRLGAPFRRATVDLGGLRTGLLVPMRKDNRLLGTFNLGRQQVQPFTDRQIELVRTFADQAVIAIENARLITETREALEQQTATAEVLGVINSSPGDLAPVFEVILEKAHSLCAAAIGSLSTWDGEYFQAMADHGFPEIFAELVRRPFRPNACHQPLVDGERYVHIPDTVAWAAERNDPALTTWVENSGVRTFLGIPLPKDSRLLGFISAARLEVRAFSEREIALLESFAAQAVIAMENARLLGEIRQRQAELRVTFDNMADGVVMFDEDLRLTAWNRNFQELLDVPDALLAKRPSYTDYLRSLAERGEFGTDDIEAELSRRLGETDQELRLERMRPDGRVIEVRRNSVPDGGFVLIYSDITERKRSEAEIRAARDTAEGTLRDLRAAQANLIQAEKMASLGQLTAGIAHEIKNPLNFVNNFADLSVELLDELKETPAIATLDKDKRAEVDETLDLLTGNLERIAEHGKRADNIVKSMLEHSRGVTGERRSVDLNVLVEEALNLAYHGARAQDQTFNITLEHDYAPTLKPIEVAPQEMTRVFLNIFGNGFYAANKRVRENGGGSFRPILTVATRDLGGEVVDDASGPRPRRAAEDRRQHHHPEDAAVMPAGEDFRRDRPHHRGQAVAERALRHDHHAEERDGRLTRQRDQHQAAHDKAAIADRPDPFAADAVRQMAERDLAGHRYQADQAQRPGRVGRGKPDLGQVFGLVHLHRVPGEQAAKIAGGEPPEAARPQRPGERPVDRGPGGVDDIRRGLGGRSRRRLAVRMKADILGPMPQQQVQRPQQRQHQHAEHPAPAAPAAGFDPPLQPGQDRDRADPDPGKRDADRQAAAPHEPVRQIERLAGIGEAVDPAAGERAEGQVKLPRLVRESRQQQAGAHRGDPDLDHHQRSAPVHQPPDPGRDQRRHQKPERERARRHSPVPAELREDGREQQREGGAGIDPDRHRDKRDPHQQPAIEERQPHAAAHGGGSRRRGVFAHRPLLYFRG